MTMINYEIWTALKMFIIFIFFEFIHHKIFLAKYIAKYQFYIVEFAFSYVKYKQDIVINF